METPAFGAIIISNRIRDYRKERAITQEELAEAVGVSRQSIISVETGKCLPSVPLAIAIAHFFDSPLETLFITDQHTEDEFVNRVDYVFENSLASFQDPSSTLTPLMNIYQTDKDIVVEADVPGMKEDDIEIEITDNVLTIKGERKHEEHGLQKEYFHREVQYGAFHRAVTLPVPVMANKATATTKQGQLRLVLPKVEPQQPKVHKISAKSA